MKIVYDSEKMTWEKLKSMAKVVTNQRNKLISDLIEAETDVKLGPSDVDKFPFNKQYVLQPYILTGNWASIEELDLNSIRYEIVYIPKNYNPNNPKMITVQTFGFNGEFISESYTAEPRVGDRTKPKFDLPLDKYYLFESKEELDKQMNYIKIKAMRLEYERYIRKSNEFGFNIKDFAEKYPQFLV